MPRKKTKQENLRITYVVDEAAPSMTYEEAMAKLRPLIHLLARQAARECCSQLSSERMVGSIAESESRTGELQDEPRK